MRLPRNIQPPLRKCDSPIPNPTRSPPHPIIQRKCNTSLPIDGRSGVFFLCRFNGGIFFDARTYAVGCVRWGVAPHPTREQSPLDPAPSYTKPTPKSTDTPSLAQAEVFRCIQHTSLFAPIDPATNTPSPQPPPPPLWHPTPTNNSGPFLNIPQVACLWSMMTKISARSYN